jgi:hypothetical protein
MSANDPPDWTQDICVRIGQALLTVESRTLTAPRIAEATGLANINRAVEPMVEAGMLESRPPPPARPGTRGRRPSKAYFLPDAALADLQAALARTHPVGQFRAGQQAVFARAGEGRVADLYAALASSSALARASWFSVFDGEPQEIGVVFAGEGAVANALELMTELDTADVRARRVAVSDLGGIEMLVVRARRAARAGQRNMMRRATREAS